VARASGGVKVVLVGAGGHAKAVIEGLQAQGADIVGYVDRRKADWLRVRQYERDEEFSDQDAAVVIGLGGVTPDELSRRAALAAAWKLRGFRLPAVVHPNAIVSRSAQIGEGAQVLAGAIVQPDARVGDAVIVNTGAIVEHDATIGGGSHVAPGAKILGAATVGQSCMIGAGAVVLPMTCVPDRSLVAAATRWERNAP
jgi:sugar O-acyltransferase (sialic acid O-acetyltransferase NeuD family)